MQHTEPVQRIPRVAAYLGYGGVIPFAVVVLNQFASGPVATSQALDAFVFYSAVILSFLGGIRWGAATRLKAGMSRELMVSVMPSLWAVACLLLSRSDWTIWGLLLGFLAIGSVDVLRPAPGLAKWMTRLRLQLTTAVLICHLLLLVALQ